MKLCILVVYFLPDERIPVLDLHLRAISTRTHGDFVIYGAAPRVSASVRSHIQAASCVRLLDLEPTTNVGSMEHSYYLNQLADQAVADGYDRLCAMDVDAFPIVPGWNDQMEEFVEDGNVLTAIFRQENGDTALPHPSCCYLSADFYKRYRPHFLPEAIFNSESVYSEFLRSTGQKIDSGIGVGYVLWKHGLPWKKLLRSNKINEHFLLAGIYGDLIFHLGAMSWTDRDFRKDRTGSWLLRLLDALEGWARAEERKHGTVGMLWTQINYMATRKLVRRTNATFDRALVGLSEDPDTFIARLLGR